MRQDPAAPPGTQPATSRAAVAPGPPPAASLVGASVRYGALVALAPTTLSVAAGERVAVVGPSGAGKSTLLRLMATALAPTAGTVRVLGEEVAALAPRRLRALRARIGTVHQQLWLVPRATALQNVIAGRLGRTSLLRSLAALVSGGEAARVAAVLDRVDLADRLHERVDRLSGGEQQRVAIARVLHQDPDLVIADEPLSSVDPTRAAELAALLAAAFAGRSLVVTTHRLEPLLPHVGRVVGLRGGAVAFDKPAAAVTLDDLGRLYEAASARRAASPRTPPASPPRDAPASPPSAASRGGGGPGPAAEVSISASTTPGEHLLPRSLREFCGAHPGVRVTLAVKDSAGVAADLLAGRADVGFLGARTPHPLLRFEAYAEDEVVLVTAPAAAPEAPLAPEDASRLPRVEREAGSGTRRVVEEHFRNLGAPLDPGAVVAEVGSLSALRTAAAAGVGAAWVSRAAVRDELDAGRLRVVAVAGVRIPRRFFVAWRSDAAPQPAASRFVEMARARGLG